MFESPFAFITNEVKLVYAYQFEITGTAVKKNIKWL